MFDVSESLMGWPEGEGEDVVGEFDPGFEFVVELDGYMACPTSFALPPRLDPIDSANAFPYWRYEDLRSGMKARRLSIETADLPPRVVE